MFRMNRSTYLALAALFLGLLPLPKATALPPQSTKKVKQVPFLVNGRPVPRVTAEILGESYSKATKELQTPAGKSNVARTGHSLSARENILMPSIKALMAKASGNAATSAAGTRALAPMDSRGTSNNTTSFPGFQNTPFALGAPATDTSVTYTSVTTDVNKDGKQDLVVIQNDGTVNVLLNPGTGNFADWKITSSNTTAVLNPSVYYIESQAIDLNGDGYPDLCVTDLVNNAEFVYINDQKGSFLDPVEYDINFSSGTTFNGEGGGVIFTDTNGDGIPDMIAVGIDREYNASTVSIVVQLGVAGGTFAPPLPEQTTAFKGTLSGEFGNLSVGDLNKDGKIDLVVPVLGYDSSYKTTSFIAVLTGMGDGTFSNFPSTFPTTGAILNLNDASYGSHFVADIDGDGNPDVIYSPASLGGLWLAKGNGDGTLQTPTKLLSNLGNLNNGGAPIVNFADVNGDGNIDVIAYNYGYISVFLNKGKGVFDPVPAAQLASGNGSVSQPLPADFNNDGKIDIVMVDETSSHIGFYAGVGTSFAGNATVQPAGETASGFEMLATADFNGDGFPDIVAADTSREVDINDQPDIVVGTNDGKGNFTYTTAIPSAVVASSDVSTVYQASSDLNGDGKADLVIEAYSDAADSYVLSVAFSNGDGTFATPVNLSLGTAISCSLGYVDIGDLNGDGFKDIVVAYQGDANCNSYSPGTVQPGVFVLLNDGKGNFTSSFTAFGYAPQIPKLIDFNGDGKLDLALSDAQSTNGFYYLYAIPGNGDGTFNQAGAQYVLESAAVTSIIPGDFDGDGVQDLTVGVETQVDGNDIPIVSTTGIYLMKGNGDFTFQQPVIYGMGTFPYDGAYADLNGDGKPDLVLSQGTLVYYTDVFTPSFVYYENLGGGALTPGATSFSPVTTYNGAILPADYNGDGAIDVISVVEVIQGYNSTFSSDLFLNAGGDSLALVASASTVVQNQSVTLKATVSSTVNTGTPTGSVTFYDNGALLATVSLSGNSASLSLTTLPVGTNVITAKYSGDGSFNAATAAGVSVVVTSLSPAFTLGPPSPSTLTVTQGKTGAVEFNLSSNSTFDGVVTLTCSGAPAESSCAVLPATVTLSGAQTIPVSAVVTTTPPNNTTSAKNESLQLFGLAGGVSLASFIILLPASRRRRLPKLMMLVLVFASTGVLSIALIGCSGDGYKYPGTPIGSSTLTVTATSGSSTQSQTFQLNITK